jgi:hypothetical protein
MLTQLILVIERLGPAPAGARCDCEHVDCERDIDAPDAHIAGGCQHMAVEAVRLSGLRAALCAPCLRRWATVSENRPKIVMQWGGGRSVES